MVVRGFRVAAALLAAAFVLTGFSGCISKKETENTASATISGNSTPAEKTWQLREPEHFEFEGEIGVELYHANKTRYKFPVDGGASLLKIKVTSEDSIPKGFIGLNVYDSKGDEIEFGDDGASNLFGFPDTLQVFELTAEFDRFGCYGNYSLEVFNGYGITPGMKYKVAIDVEYRSRSNIRSINGTIPFVFFVYDEMALSRYTGAYDSTFQFSFKTKPEKIILIVNYTSSMGEIKMDIRKTEDISNQIYDIQGSGGQAIITIEDDIIENVGWRGIWETALFGGILYSDGPLVDCKYTLTLISVGGHINDFYAYHYSPPLI